MKSLSSILPALASLFWGGAIVYLYAAGRMGEFLVPKFHLITLFGGLGMIVLGLFVLLTLREKSDCGHDHCEHDHDHHDQNPWVVLFLMIAPLSAALATDTSAGYSLDVLERKGLFNNQVNAAAYQLPPFTREMLEQSTPRNDEGHYQLPVSQIFFSSGDESMREVFTGIPVETEGQVVRERERNEDGRRLRIYRTLMTCCAADAMVLGFPLEFTAPPSVEERGWIRVAGTLGYEETPDGPSPVLQVETVESIPAPRDAGFTGW
ncbi:TIGR03943 family putative permease subunit [Roseibacillus ishigakijimensis]|uniref:TIGR03943 family protein n=1 Tax=Roseibacillus ishigakijimensis TaxID=454146 RepID=A0A934RTE7_9BACT|nr:TIGR03943 family protein [Roseibacillus ishigakijimensis]MBK1835617.1 TIGR03943 family protein [Roseibacillus ishigakijimensis]